MRHGESAVAGEGRGTTRRFRPERAKRELRTDLSLSLGWFFRVARAVRVHRRVSKQESISEPSGVGLNAQRITRIQYISRTTESPDWGGLQDYFRRQISRAQGRAPGSSSTLVSQELARSASVQKRDPERSGRGSAKPSPQGGTRQGFGGAATDGTVRLSSRLSTLNAGKQSFVISRFRFVRVPFGAPFIPNRSGKRNPKTPPEDGAPLVPAPRFPKRDVLSVSPSCATQTPRRTSK